MMGKTKEEMSMRMPEKRTAEEKDAVETLAGAIERKSRQPEPESHYMEED